MNKTIVNVERINDCIPKLNIAKSGFYNFESGAFNHSATLPTVYLQAHNDVLFIIKLNQRAFISHESARGASGFGAGMNHSTPVT